jgi:hypothetical protein
VTISCSNFGEENRVTIHMLATFKLRVKCSNWVINSISKSFCQIVLGKPCVLPACKMICQVKKHISNSLT